jgi:hypothetical protein
MLKSGGPGCTHRTDEGVVLVIGVRVAWFVFGCLSTSLKVQRWVPPLSILRQISPMQRLSASCRILLLYNFPKVVTATRNPFLGQNCENSENPLRHMECIRSQITPYKERAIEGGRF